MLPCYVLRLYRDLLGAAQGRRRTTIPQYYYYHYYYYFDVLHCCTRQYDRPLSTRTVKMGDPNVTGNTIDAARGFAAREGQPRPTEDEAVQGRLRRTC